MKKYLLKILSAFFVLIALSSCEQEKIYYNGEKALASFDRTSKNFPVFEFKESVAVVRVNVSTLSNVDRAMVVEIDTEKSTATEDQYSIDESTLVVIPAGSYHGDIKVTAFYSQILDDNKHTIVFNLKSVEGAILENGEVSNTHTLTLFRSCPLDSNLIENGIFEGKSYKEELLPGNLVDTFNPVFTKYDDNQYLVNTLWGESFVNKAENRPDLDGQYIYPGRLIIRDDYTVTIIGFQGGMPGGTGEYDPCTNTFNLILTQELLPIGQDNKYPVFVTLQGPNPN